MKDFAVTGEYSGKATRAAASHSHPAHRYRHTSADRAPSTTRAPSIRGVVLGSAHGLPNSDPVSTKPLSECPLLLPSAHVTQIALMPRKSSTAMAKDGRLSRAGRSAGTPPARATSVAGTISHGPSGRSCIAAVSNPRPRAIAPVDPLST